MITSWESQDMTEVRPIRGKRPPFLRFACHRTPGGDLRSEKTIDEMKLIHLMGDFYRKYQLTTGECCKNSAGVDQWLEWGKDSQLSDQDAQPLFAKAS